jgi:hypothetical protein
MFLAKQLSLEACFANDKPVAFCSKTTPHQMELIILRAIKIYFYFILEEERISTLFLNGLGSETDYYPCNQFII